MYFYFAFSGLLNAVTSTLMGYLVYSRDKNNHLNKTFALFCFFVAIWSYPYIFWPLADTAQDTLFWFRILHIGAIYTSVAYCHFVLVWLGLYKGKERKVIIWGYCLATFFVLFVFSPYFIAGMTPRYSIKYWADPGVLYYFYLIFFFGYALYSSFHLFVSYRHATGTRRVQIKYILIGMILTYLGGSTNYFLFFDINFPPFGNILASSYVVLSAYIIIAHRFMDIKVVMRKYSVYLSSLFSIIIFVFVLRYFTVLILDDFSMMADFFILLFCLVAYPVVTKYYYQFSNKYFFSSLYDSKEVIAKLNEGLRTTLDINRIFEHIYHVSRDAFHFKAFGVLRFVENKGHFAVGYNKGFKINPRVKFPKNLELYKKYFVNDEPIVIKGFPKEKFNKKTQNLIEVCDKYEVNVIIPFRVKDKTIAIMIVGAKESGEGYDDNDLQMLKIIASQSSISIENALLYKETLGFNIKLKEEVANATKDLRSANKKLLKLDEAKSEFISIASHQLRTPLTVIKGYISMMLEGSFGKLDKIGEESLKKVYESNERLINLVENLLNISRIESGRLQFVYNKMGLNFIVDSVIEELEENAKKKDLKLVYKKPKKDLSEFMMDSEKIRQVVMNLIDNAIKYTAKGDIVIKIGEAKGKVSFSVSDNGIGISSQDIKNLFKKFSRGTGTSLVHTEGTGLGLYVAKQMVEAHGGKIWAESKGEGAGSEFCFELPINNEKYLKNNN